MSSTAKYSKATSITIYSLGIFLGALHIFFGLIALTPMISPDYHREMKINFNAFAKSLTSLYEFGDRANLAFYLRYFMATCQATFGAMLIENGHFGPFGKVGNYGLIFIDLIYLLFQLSVGSSYERIAPTVVFTLLLITRLTIIMQSMKKVKVGVKSRNVGKPKTSTPKKNKNE